MRRSAIGATLVLVALLVCLSTCSGPPEPGELSEKAHAAWKLYLDRPAKDTFENFQKANRDAARLHGDPHDGVGVEYQLRALETEAAEAERTSDATLAEGVSTRIQEIESHDLVGNYDQARPGARRRLDDAKARVAGLTR